jgi:hypothetical protein
MAAPNPSMVKFLKVFGCDQAGHLPLFDLSDKRHVHFRTDDLENAAVFAEQASDQRHDVYVRANVQGDPFGTTAATVAAMTVLTLDFDIVGPGHKTESKLPASYADFFTVLEKADVPMPTELLKTGGGLLAIWGLERPFMIGSEADRDRAKNLSRRFQRHIAQVAKDMNMHVDSTFDLVRACRLPGTRNWKPAYGPSGAPVEIYQ